VALLAAASWVRGDPVHAAAARAACAYEGGGEKAAESNSGSWDEKLPQWRQSFAQRLNTPGILSAFALSSGRASGDGHDPKKDIETEERLSVHN